MGYQRSGLKIVEQYGACRIQILVYKERGDAILTFLG